MSIAPSRRAALLGVAATLTLAGSAIAQTQTLRIGVTPGPHAQIEPHLICRRLIFVSQAALAGISVMA